MADKSVLFFTVQRETVSLTAEYFIIRCSFQEDNFPAAAQHVLSLSSLLRRRDHRGGDGPGAGCGAGTPPLLLPRQAHPGRARHLTDIWSAVST